MTSFKNACFYRYRKDILELTIQMKNLILTSSKTTNPKIQELFRYLYLESSFAFLFLGSFGYIFATLISIQVGYN